MILGNLLDEHKYCGMQFKDFELFGDIPLPHAINNTFIEDGRYIYSVSNEFGDPPRNLNIHRLDMRSRKWELLYKTNTLGSGPEPKYEDEFIMYKGGIYIFGLSSNRMRNMPRSFMVSVQIFLINFYLIFYYFIKKILIFSTSSFTTLRYLKILMLAK